MRLVAEPVFSLVSLENLVWGIDKLLINQALLYDIQMRCWMVFISH